MANFAFAAFLFCVFTNLYAQEQPGPGYTSYRQGMMLAKSNKCNDAIVKFQEALKLEPENYKYQFQLGKCYYKLRNYEQAINAFEYTTQLNPNYTAAYSLTAKLYSSNQDWDNAILNYEQAFQYESNTQRRVQYKLLIISMLKKADRTSEMARHIEDAKSVAPDNPEILYLDAKIKNEDGDYQGAKEDLLVAVEKMGEAPPAKSAKYYYELGYAYNKLNDYDNAQDAWQKANFGPYKKLIARERSLNSPKYYYSMAISYYYSSQYEEARAQIQKALELQKDFSPGYTLMAKMARKQGKYGDAVNHLEKAIGMEANDSKKLKLQMMATQWQMDAGDFSGALSNANELLSKSPSNSRIGYMKALAQYKLGQYSASISTIDGLLNSGSLDNKTKAQLSFILGMAAKESSDAERAKEAFKNAMYGPFKPAAKNELDKLMGKS